MPYAPQLASALESLALPWPSAPLRPAILNEAHSAPDFFDDLPSLDKWYVAQCRARGLSENHHLVYSGGQLRSRDELCETADAQKTPGTMKEGSKGDDERPKLLVCHDFQGGFNDRPDRRGYTFEYWSLADAFIYFSHRRISCPPMGWNTAASRHGVKMLGTVIFEWKEAIPELSLLLRGPHDSYSPLKPPLRYSPFYIPALIDLALSSNFSGYLINVELPLDLGFSVSGYTWYPDWLRPTSAAEKDEMQRNARRLRAWVALLRSEGQRRFREAGRGEDEWTVLWYDSVTREGKLQWQDAVTRENLSFLEVSDGIFTNYTWARPPKPKIEQPDMPGGPAPGENLTSDMSLSSHPQYDVDPHPALSHSVTVLDKLARRSRSEAYIGIDVFGRNCWGGAQTWRTLDMIGSSAWWQKRLSGTMAGAFSPSSAVADLGLSVALFAPGWTWEHAEPGTTIDPPPPTSAWGQASEDRTEPGRRLWEEFAELDARFWTGGRSSSTEMILSSSSAAETHSFKRALNAYFPARAPPLLNNASPMDTSAPAPHVFYHTTFARGSGTAWYVSGRQVARWKAEEEPATVSSISELDFSPVVDDDNDDKKRKAKEALEDRARARVLVGWTDAGVSLPKPDATWPRPSCVWVSTSEQKLGSTEVTTVAATALGVTSVGLHGSASSAALVDAEFSEDPDHVWMGNCSLRLRLPSRSDEKPVHSLFVPVSWVPFPPTSQEGGVEQSIQATAYVHGLHTVQGRMRLGMRFVDGSILQGRNEAEPQLPNSSWTQVSTTFSITGDRIRKSTPHASMQAQAILGFILDSTTADDQAAKDDRLSEIYIGELCLSTATASARDQDQRTPSSTSHSLQVERGQDDLLLLTWPDFAPAAHFYEVFAQSPSHGGGDGERSWLGTATRERSRTEFVIPLPAVRSIVGTSVGEGEGVRFVVRPFGSCWGDACGIGLLPG